MKRLLAYALSFCCGMPFFVLGQPIRTTLLFPAAGAIRSSSPAAGGIRSSSPAVGGRNTPPLWSIRVINDSLRKNYTNVTLEWQLWVNGLLAQKATVPGLALFPGQPRTVRLPLRLPAGGEEAFVRVSYRSPNRPQGPSITTQQLKLKTWGGDASIPGTGELTFTDSNDIFMITSQKLRILFDKQTGWIQSYEVGRFGLVSDTNGLRPAINGTPHLQLFSTSTGSQMVIVRAEYTLPDIACLLHLSYTINAAGNMLVEQSVEADTTRQDTSMAANRASASPDRVLPIDHFGMDWMLPPDPDSIAWYGPAPGEDTGAIAAIQYQRISPDLGQDPTAIPSSVMVRWWSVIGPDGRGFRLSADSNFLSLSLSPRADSSFRPLPIGARLHIASSLFHPLPRDKYRYAYKVTPISSR